MPSSEPDAGTHVDADTLALLALGEQATPGDEAHLRECERCREEVTGLRHVVTAVRDHEQPLPVTPPAVVWDRIAAVTGVSVDRREAVGDDLLELTVDAGPDSGEDDEPVEDGDADERAAVRVIRPAAPGRHPARRRLPWRAVAAGVAAGLVVGIGATLALTGARENGPEVVQRTPLRVVTGPAGLATGAQAALLRVDGRRQLRISAPDLATRENAFYEVWLLSPDAQRMVPVGVLVGSGGTLAVPPGLDVEDYPVVDISAEPYDGDPAHSGDSVLRGTLGV